MSPARSPRPRAHVHRGSVEAVAFWFDPALLGEAEARRRVLAAWAPGAGVYALDGGLLLRLPAPRRMACATAPGLPFTLVDGVLLSTPLSPSERERLAPSAGSAVLVRAGLARVHALEPSLRVDVSAWLDVSGWDVVPVEHLGAPPPPVPTFAPVEAPPRARFGVDAPAPEAEVMRARLEGRPVPPLPRAPGLLESLRAWWQGTPRRPGGETVNAGPSARASLLDRLRAWWKGRGDGASSPGRSASAGKALPAPPPPPQGPGLWSRLTEWLATATPLGALLGQRKAEYVRKLFDLFDEGNLHEALRYAIPLDKGPPSENARVSLGLPGPREQLTLQPRHGGAASVFGGGAAVYEALRERYRAAFQKLEREGRIEEAAFVLAELLQEAEEAVSFLERHGRLRLAAELAEGRKLAPGLVVRQWVLARDVGRAVDLARRTGAFADAVLRLERSHPDEARVLRLLWGEVLAQSGDYARAVEVVWPVADARGLTWAWLERGVEVGGVSGARLLVRMLSAFPERFDTVRTRALALLDGEDAEGAPARQTFTEVLARGVEQERSGGEGGLVLLRAAVRAVLRDRAAGHLPLKSRELEHLVKLTGDTVLRADLPPLPTLPERSGFPTEGTPPVQAFDAAEGGPWPIHDAVPLSGGRLLVALGEAGARLVTKEGRCVAHFDVPAFSLVLSVHEDRALALAPRGTVTRLSRLDLTGRRAEAWCDTRVHAFSPVYDGNLWFLSVEDTVMAVDALAAEPRALWRVPQLGGQVLSVAVGPSELGFVTLDAELELERWVYALPDPTLRARQRLPGGKVEAVRHLSLRMDGELAVLAQDGLRWFGPSVRAELMPRIPETELDGLVLGGAWFATLRQTPSDRWVRLHERKQGALRAQFLFEGTVPVSVRFHQGELLLFDTLGRLARVDPARGEVRRVVLR